MVILCVDPGKTTGICVVEIPDVETIYHTGEMNLFWGIDDLLDRFRPDVVVMERFLGGRAAADPCSPCTTIGAVEYMARQRNMPVVMQSPAILKKYMPLARKAGSSRHVRAAYAHALFYAEGHARG